MLWQIQFQLLSSKLFIHETLFHLKSINHLQHILNFKTLSLCLLLLSFLPQRFLSNHLGQLLIVRRRREKTVWLLLKTESLCVNVFLVV
ncbi:CLUMA_CG007302, isoform A [Clunio marinus]|uniref:CLUMA_CG007302, isoform A n=1 Tax=Clunio marinus TaxID=568069 RepID=A0A1J1I4H1_9DIPT|nr:CLUMA_CG007302, isoform A [Clunio marinus]